MSNLEEAPPPYVMYNQDLGQHIIILPLLQDEAAWLSSCIPRNDLFYKQMQDLVKECREADLSNPSGLT